MKNKLLIVVDYQNDFVNGSLPCGKFATDIEQNIVSKIEQYRKNGHSILATLDTHTENYINTREAIDFPAHCIEGTEGHKLFGKIAEFNLPTITKHTFGCIQLANHPLCRAADEFEFIGVATNVCVLHNVILIYNSYPDKKISVDASCCASFDERLHQNALEIMRGFGINITNLQ